MSGYELSRKWFAFVFETKGVRPVHTALYFWIIERANASGWKAIIDIQTEKSMECLGVTDWRTYKNALQFLHDHGFIKWIEKSKNQFTCNKIILVNNVVIDAESFRSAYANNAEPNAEAIAEAIAEAYAEPIVEAIAEALQSYINLKTYKPPNKQTSKPNSLHQSAIAAFVENYSFRFKTEYIFNGGKDGQAVKSLIAKIKKKTEEGGGAATDENLLNGFKLFIESVTDNWVLDNFSPALLNSKFNELFKQAKNGKQFSSNQTRAGAARNSIDLGLLGAMVAESSAHKQSYQEQERGGADAGQDGPLKNADGPYYPAGDWGYPDHDFKAAG